MNNSFDDAFAFTVGIEGGYSNNPADPGGETMWGITRETARANGYAGAMKDLPLDTAKEIAKRKYWDVVQGDQLPPAVALQMFDIQYNGGHAAQWLQKAVGVPVDGAIGAVTIGRVRMCNPLAIIMQLNAFRAEYYASIRNPAMISGWVNRLAKCLRKGQDGYIK